MTKQLLDYDPTTKISTYHDYDDSTDTTFIRTEQDCSDILEINKFQRNEGFDKKSEMWHAASIPAVVQMEWITKYGIDLMNPDHMPGVKRLLNSGDYAYLKRSEITI
tara:strand:+ start:1128 stop:1448 length:321 start_codon:yes stop_codon:yes gene_type:complete